MSAPLFRQPSIFKQFTQLIAAESTRHGGVSPAPYHSLNLGKNTADDPVNVQENRRRFAAALGFDANQFAWSKQVHGDAVYVAQSAGGVEGYDALVTRAPGVVLAVSVADCTPVLIYDAKNRVVAAVHAGWKGSVAGITGKTLELLRTQFGTHANNCYAYVGTCIDECTYEVGLEVAAAFDPAHKRLDEKSGKFCVDLKRANADQLRAFGIPEAQIEISPYSTVLHNADYFSHRLEKGLTGRMNAVIGLR